METKFPYFLFQICMSKIRYRNFVFISRLTVWGRLATQCLRDQTDNYPQQEGYVFELVGWSVCLSVGILWKSRCVSGQGTTYYIYNSMFCLHVFSWFYHVYDIAAFICLLCSDFVMLIKQRLFVCINSNSVFFYEITTFVYLYLFRFRHVYEITTFVYLYLFWSHHVCSTDERYIRKNKHRWIVSAE